MPFFKSLKISSTSSKKRDRLPKGSQDDVDTRERTSVQSNDDGLGPPPAYSLDPTRSGDFRSRFASDVTTLVPQGEMVTPKPRGQSVPIIRRKKVPINLNLPNEPSDNYVKRGELTPGERRCATLPKELWCYIADFLTLSSQASLALCSKTLRHKLGPSPWALLNAPENKQERLLFLQHIDPYLPSHLLCFLCATYHLRLNPGLEKLRPNMVLNPLYHCPLRKTEAYPRARLTHGRELPFAFVQLALRGHRHSPAHGVDLDSLSRTWRCKDSDWAHSTRFHVHNNGHLLMRVQSTAHAAPCMTPNQQRLLLFSRSDYAPYFSVCAHWASYNLIPVCKCALGHVPEPAQGVFTQLRERPSVSLKKLNTHILPKQCEECKPLRRCPECPTEYLVQLKLVEDKLDREHQFKQAIVVTRWSDLGDGSSPRSPEWAACVGDLLDFDSMAAVGTASITSLFEMAVSRGAPGERMVWLQRGGLVNGKRLMEDVY